MPDRKSTAGMLGRAASTLPRLAGRAASTLLRLGGQAAFLGLVVAAVLWLVREKDADPAAQGAEVTIAGDDRVRLLVASDGLGAQGFSRFVLRDAEGLELMTFHVYRDRTIHFNMGLGTPSRAAGFARGSGNVGLSVRNDRGAYHVTAQKDGSSVVEILSLDARVLRTFRVTPDGKVVSEPPWTW